MKVKELKAMLEFYDEEAEIKITGPDGRDLEIDEIWPQDGNLQMTTMEETDRFLQIY